MSFKLTTKDLINTGIFGALYFAVMLLCAGIALVPVIHMLITPINALVAAPVFLLLIAKTQKPFCITIVGFLCSIITGFVIYGSIVCFFVCFAFFLVAEAIAFAGKYKSMKINCLSYIVASYWTIGVTGVFWFAKDYAAQISSGTADEFAMALTKGVIEISTPETFVLVMILTAICGFISTVFARRILRKHFKKAGIVTV